MNLGKLLGAGKSFFGAKGAAAYRQKKDVYLPKFNSEKNPFAPKAPATAPATDVAPPKVKKDPAPTVVPSTTPVSARTKAKSDAGPTRSVSWVGKWNPFGSSPLATPPAVNGVQVELSLEDVKVVHNDLGDADIEIVPVKSQTIAVEASPVLPSARHSWEFLGERLVKIG